VIVAVPAVAPVTIPLVEIVATPELDEDQVIDLFVNTMPLAFRTIAVNVVSAPVVMAWDAGEIVTVSGPVTPVGPVCVTLIVAVPCTRSLVAVIVAVPAVAPVTNVVIPAVPIVIPGLDEDQLTCLFVNTLPLASFTVAVNVVVFPASIL
jgi:hypothetical protein